MHDDVYEALYQALTNPTVHPRRHTFGKVEYAYIPVHVVEAVLEDQWGDEVAEDMDVDEDFSVSPAPRRLLRNRWSPTGDTEPVILKPYVADAPDVFSDEAGDEEE